MEDWISEAIELEATPKAAREISVSDFAKEKGIDRRTYYYHMGKPENEKKVLELSLSQAKKGTSDVLDKLRQKAEDGSEKSIEMYLKFILALKERTDVTSNDKEIPIYGGNSIQEHISDKEDISTDKENQGS